MLKPTWGRPKYQSRDAFGKELPFKKKVFTITQELIEKATRKCAKNCPIATILNENCTDKSIKWTVIQSRHNGNPIQGAYRVYKNGQIPGGFGIKAEIADWIHDFDKGQDTPNLTFEIHEMKDLTPKGLHVLKLIKKEYPDEHPVKRQPRMHR